MKKALTVVPILIALAVVAGAGYFYFADRSTPVGQPSLVEINPATFEAFKEQFNADQGRERIIALLSPT